jgi:hypothetical protein
MLQLKYHENQILELLIRAINNYELARVYNACLILRGYCIATAIKQKSTMVCHDALCIVVVLNRLFGND